MRQTKQEELLHSRRSCHLRPSIEGEKVGRGCRKRREKGETNRREGRVWRGAGGLWVKCCLGHIWEPGGWSLTHALYKLEHLEMTECHRLVGRSTDRKAGESSQKASRGEAGSFAPSLQYSLCRYETIVV